MACCGLGLLFKSLVEAQILEHGGRVWSLTIEGGRRFLNEKRGGAGTQTRGCSEKQKKQNSVVALFNTRPLRLKSKRIIY